VSEKTAEADLPFHAVASLFPLMEGKDFEDLKADIQAHGQREPVWTHEGAIIDGRNRYRACQDLGIKPKLREWDGKGSLVAFVVSLNLHRRHLSSSQRAAVAAEMLPLLEAEAKGRQRQAGVNHGRGRPRKVGQKVDEPSDGNAGRATQEAARIAGTNRQYVAEAGRIRKQAPDLFEQIKHGTLKVTQARQKLREREKRADNAKRAAEAEAARQRQPEENISREEWQRIVAEVEARPEFLRRKAEADRLRRVAEAAAEEKDAEIDRLMAEIERLNAEIEERCQEIHRPRWRADVADSELRNAVLAEARRVVTSGTTADGAR
jgi:hypothetical protein